MSGPRTLADVIGRAEVIVCCGTGGVGKTSVAASLAHAGARAGRRCVVVTIDPARRLADAIGLRGRVGNEPVLVPGVGPGEMWATMLDVRETFDALVDACARDERQATTIKTNRYYRNIGGSLSGTRDYMAAERLLALHTDGRFDLVIVDTPPSRNALDFLEAPERLARFLEHRLYRLLVAPARGGLRVVGAAVQPVLRAIGKVVGGDALADVVEFLRAFDGMEEGFRTRARRTASLLRGPTASFVLVTTARPEALEESVYLAGQLSRLSVPVAALVANRMPPSFTIADDSDGDGTSTVADGANDPVMSWLHENLAEMNHESDVARDRIADLAGRIGAGPDAVTLVMDTPAQSGEMSLVAMISNGLTTGIPNGPADGTRN
jgi:anion-transporting  ArsA/GET3 family ATPase